MPLEMRNKGINDSTCDLQGHQPHARIAKICHQIELVWIYPPLSPFLM